MFDLFDRNNHPTTLRIRVTPKAKSSRIKKEIAEDGSVYYKVYVTVAAEDGKANQAVLALLAEALDVPKSSLTIMRGLTGREKIIQVRNLNRL